MLSIWIVTWCFSAKGLCSNHRCMQIKNLNPMFVILSVVLSFQILSARVFKSGLLFFETRFFVCAREFAITPTIREKRERRGDGAGGVQCQFPSPWHFQDRADEGLGGPAPGLTQGRPRGEVRWKCCRGQRSTSASWWKSRTVRRCNGSSAFPGLTCVGGCRTFTFSDNFPTEKNKRTISSKCVNHSRNFRTTI